jgi:ribosomal protein S18 acetylase RimI-like enzyme
MAKPKTADPAALKRESAGRYASTDGRFIVEQASGGWMATDAEQRNELGLPLVRGPYRTLAEAKAAVEGARVGPAPASALADRIAALPARPPATEADPDPDPEPDPEPVPAPPPVEIRGWRPSDGDALRHLWQGAGMLSPWDDDEHLGSMAARNPGLMLVATVGCEVAGSALGAWDGRRGWIYHVATAPGHRRRGIGRQLVTRIEAGLRELGCPKVNVIVLDDNEEGVAFWIDLGYTMLPARQFGRRLNEERLRAT